MYRTAFARPPTPRETAEAVAFLKQQGAAYDLNDEAAKSDLRVWTDLAARADEREGIYILGEVEMSGTHATSRAF